MRSFAEQVVALAATLTAMGVLIRLKPMRWVLAGLFGHPVDRAREAFRVEVASVVVEVLDSRPLTNGWGTRTLDAIASAVDADTEPPSEHHQPQERP